MSQVADQSPTMPPMVRYWIILSEPERWELTVRVLRHCKEQAMIDIPDRVFKKSTTPASMLKSFQATIRAESKKSESSEKPSEEDPAQQIVRELLESAGGTAVNRSRLSGESAGAFESTRAARETWFYRWATTVAQCSGIIPVEFDFQKKDPSDMQRLQWQQEAVPVIMEMLGPPASRAWKTTELVPAMLDIAREGLSRREYAKLIYFLIDRYRSEMSEPAQKMQELLGLFAEGKLSQGQYFSRAQAFYPGTPRINEASYDASLLSKSALEALSMRDDYYSHRKLYDQIAEMMYLSSSEKTSENGRLEALIKGMPIIANRIRERLPELP